MNTTNNTILITGGATGIGLAMAEEFLKLGNTVIICGRREEKLNEAKAKNPALNIHKCDVSNQSDRTSLVKWILENFPQTNMLINNAGMQNHLDLKHPVDTVSVQLESDTNFLAPVFLSSLFADHLKTKKEAAIINISSGLAFTPLALVPVYCATKAALHSFSLSLRHQLSSTSIKVFEIAPPLVDTELDRGARAARGQRDCGMQPVEFAKQAIDAIRDNVYECAVGMAANLMKHREGLFGKMNA